MGAKNKKEVSELEQMRRNFYAYMNFFSHGENVPDMRSGELAVLADYFLFLLEIKNDKINISVKKKILKAETDKWLNKSVLSAHMIAVQRLNNVYTI